MELTEAFDELAARVRRAVVGVDRRAKLEISDRPLGPVPDGGLRVALVFGCWPAQLRADAVVPAADPGRVGALIESAARQELPVVEWSLHGIAEMPTSHRERARWLVSAARKARPARIVVDAASLGVESRQRLRAEVRRLRTRNEIG